MSYLANEHNAINLGQGFPDYKCDPKLLELVSKSLFDHHNQYAPMPGLLKLRETLSRKIEHCYGHKVDPKEEICITAGATQAIFTAILALVKKGDEVIIIEPAYDCYRPSIEQVGGIVKAFRLRAPDYSIDWEIFSTLISDRTKLIIINTPHNPTGTVLEKEDLLALDALLLNKNIVVLSDEVYEHIIFEGKKHQSILRFEQLREKSLAVYSFGKTLHATGWKLGYIVGPKNLIEQFKSVHQWNVFSTNSFIQEALATYLDDAENYERLSFFFEEKRNKLREALSGTRLKALRSHGTYFQLYSYEKISDSNDLDFAIELVKKYGVASIPLSPFYSEPSRDKVFRLCFAKKDATIDAAANRLKNL